MHEVELENEYGKHEFNHDKEASGLRGGRALDEGPTVYLGCGEMDDGSQGTQKYGMNVRTQLFIAASEDAGTRMEEGSCELHAFITFEHDEETKECIIEKTDGEEESMTKRIMQMQIRECASHCVNGFNEFLRRMVAGEKEGSIVFRATVDFGHIYDLVVIVMNDRVIWGQVYDVASIIVEEENIDPLNGPFAVHVDLNYIFLHRLPYSMERHDSLLSKFLVRYEYPDGTRPVKWYVDEPSIDWSDAVNLEQLAIAIEPDLEKKGRGRFDAKDFIKRRLASGESLDGSVLERFVSPPHAGSVWRRGAAAAAHQNVTMRCQTCNKKMLPWRQ